jgi:phosphatidate cytidylyltransferase
MDDATRQRLFGWSHAFDHPLVKGAVIAVSAALLFAPTLFWTLTATSKMNTTLRKELWARYFSWLLLVPMMFVPILLGAAWTIAAICIMSLLCYREFARATGIFRDSITSGVVVLGILMICFAVADNWYAFFVALTPLTIATIAATALIRDQPKGYIQRVALGVLAFLLFGVCYGHLGFFANDENFRSLLVWLVINVELNDIFAYVVGKKMGHRKLAPNTSPNKTLAGSIGALVLTTTLTALTGHLVFRGTGLDRVHHLIILGLLMSATGQLGDLTLSSIKRDLGIKDWAATFPGHGGLLDRFNSMLFAAPAIFHYVGYYQGIGLDQWRRIFTGG